MPRGIPVVSQYGAPARIYQCSRWLEDFVNKRIGGRGNDCARHVERPRAGGENGRECGVGAKEVAALTPLIALGQCNLEGDNRGHPKTPWFHAGTDRLLSGALAYEFDRRARCSTVSREIPSFCILAMRVVRFRPSLEAAPLFPPTTQFVSRRVEMMWTLSASARVRTLSV